MASANKITVDFEIRDRASSELQKVRLSAKSTEEALGKMGVKAQTAIQKLEGETRRAALMAAMATQNVGNMNAALSQTSDVQIQQVASTMENVKLLCGEISTELQSTISLGADLATISTGILQLGEAFHAADIAAKLLKITLAGIGIAAIVEVLYSLYSGLWGAKEATESLTEAQERQQRVAQAASTAYGQASSQLQINIRRLKDFNGTRAEEQKLVDEMNGTYGKQMGYFESVADWYKALTENGETYCKMLVNQARLQELARQAADIEKQRHEIKYNPDGTPRFYKRNNDVKIDEKTHVVYYNKFVRMEAEAEQGYTGLLDDAGRPLKSPGQPWIHGSLSEGESYPEGLVFKPVYRRITGFDNLKDYYSDDDHIGAAIKDAKLARQLKSTYGQMEALSKEIGSVNFPVKGTITPTVSTTDPKSTSLEPTLTPGQKRGQDLTIDAWDLKTIEEYTARIDKLRELQQTANRKQYAELQRQIDQVECIKSAFESLGEVTERLGGRMVIPAKPLDSMKSTVNNALGIMDFDGKRPGDLHPTQGLRKLAEKKEDEKKKEPEPAKFEIGKLQGGWGGIKSGVNAVTSLTNAVRQGADAWTIMQTAIDGVFQMLQSVQSVMQMVNMLIQLGTASKKTDATVTLTNTGVTEADTGAKVANAAAGFFAAHSWIPWVGLGLGVAAVAAMMATMGGLPKFARGGIAYGPTLGLFGEYPGASSNPEVVAPLSRLKSLLGEPDTGLNGGVVEFHIKGRDLEGVLQKRNKLMQRI